MCYKQEGVRIQLREAKYATTDAIDRAKRLQQLLDATSRDLTKAYAQIDKLESALKGCLEALNQSTHPNAYTIVKGAAMKALEDNE